MEGGLNEELDILGEQPALYRLYTQISSIYAIPDAILHSTLVNILESGLDRLSQAFPWVAGQVVSHKTARGDAYRIVQLDRSPRLTIHRDASLPSMDDLRAANFPFSMLDENNIAPCRTLAALSFDPSTKPETSEAPVLLIQANFIRGGLILTINAQHNVMDMVGQAQVISLLSKACKNEPFSSEEIRIGNMARRGVITLLDDYTPGPEISNQIIVSTPQQLASQPPPKCLWSYVTFSDSSLAALKKLASETVPSGYISTDDALTALIWQSVLRARSHRLNSKRVVTMGRAVDVRRYLNVPATYPGLLQNMTYHKYPLEELITLPLGKISFDLRAAVDPNLSDLAYRTRALATFCSHPENRARASFTANLDLSADVTLSSWSKINLYDLDFGLGLGEPEAVRRPQFTPVESLFYMMPRAGNGEIAVALCLREEDMEKLKGDIGFTQYASFIG